MKIAIASDEISFDFETAVSLGIEWGIDCFELKRLARRRIPDVDQAEIAVVERVLGETHATLSSLAPGLFKCSLDDKAVTAEMDRLKRTIGLAHQLGIPRVVIFGFQSDLGASRASSLERVLRVLERAAAVADREGITLLLENEPGFIVDCPDTAARVAESIGSAALRLNWDPCNALACPCGTPYPEGYEVTRSHIGHVHVKDGRLQDDGSVEYVALGSGDVNWPGQLRALASDGYAGYCVLEPHFGNRVASSRIAVTRMRELLEAMTAQVAPQ